jgi:competence protein ComEA
VGWTDRFYLLTTVLLVIAAIAGGVALALEHGETEPLEITLSETAPFSYAGEVFVGGAVTNPGFYYLTDDDTLAALLSDAGLEPGADLSHIAIYVPQEGEVRSPQKIDLNRAEAWLLEALPGIGQTRAQAIVDYRSEAGPFKRVEDLLEVEGIGPETLEQIRDYVTVSD